MLKLRFAPLAAIGLSAAIAFAQEPAPDATPSRESKPDAPKVETGATPEAPAKRAPIRRKRKPVVAATPVPVATPAPKKPGFWERVFGKKKTAAKATPAPKPATPTPKPVVKKKVTTRSTATPKTTETSPADIKTTEPNPDTNKSDTAKVETKPPVDENLPPSKSEPRTKPPTIKSTKSKSGGDKVQNFPPSPDSTDADAVEKLKYDQAKAKAAADPKVHELRGKADLAPSEDESRKALRAYNKAMFKRMKEIDPSIKDRVDRMEAAVMSRLGE